MIREMSNNQRRIFIDAAQLYEAYVELSSESRSSRGGMHWKKSRGREYLFKTTNRRGNGKSKRGFVGLPKLEDYHA